MNTSNASMPIHIANPLPSQLQKLRNLWKEAFGDNDAFLDIFERTAFHPKRCRCVTIDNEVVAALYWFDCEFENQPIAYIYAVATASAHQGKGLCHALMQDTHAHLLASGYAGAILVPGSKALFRFYEKMGYQTATYIEEITYNDSMLHTFEPKSITLRSIDKTEYAALRRRYLPEHAVIQEKENLEFLETQAEFYTGDDFLLACHKHEDMLQGIELLGNTAVIPAILLSLDYKEGHFRVPGNETPFGMYYNFKENTSTPSYFGFAFD